MVVSGPALTMAWRDMVRTMESLESAQGTIPKAVSVSVTDPDAMSAALGVYTGAICTGSVNVPVPDVIQRMDT